MGGRGRGVRLPEMSLLRGTRAVAAPASTPHTEERVEVEVKLEVEGGCVFSL